MTVHLSGNPKDWSDSHRHRATKFYKCDYCGEWIDPGEYYYTWTWRDKARPNRPTVRVHAYHRYEKMNGVTR